MSYSVVPVSVVPGSGAMVNRPIKEFKLGQMQDICDYLVAQKVQEITFAGDLGLYKGQTGAILIREGLGATNVADIDVERLLQNERPIEDYVNLIGRKLREAGLTLRHVNEIVTEFRISEGWIFMNYGPLRLEMERQVDLIKDKLAAFRRQQKYPLERSSIVFDGEEMLDIPNQSSDDLLARAEHKEKLQGKVRAFAKVSTSMGLSKLAAPTVGVSTFEMCKRAGVDLVVLDSRNGLIFDSAQCEVLCERYGISVLGISL